jgi:hypothetical protein
MQQKLRKLRAASGPKAACCESLRVVGSATCYAGLTGRTRPGADLLLIKILGYVWVNGGIMDLQEFVSATLLNIINGVADARQRLGHQDRDNIAPDITSHSQVLHQQGRVLADNRVVHFVEFDVAVTVTASTSSATGATIGVVSEGTRESASASTGQSRIKFSVPITLPLSRR